MATEFSKPGQWGRDLEAAGFDTSVPTVWLLEGLMMYLSLDDSRTLMREVGRLSATGSAVFHDAVSASYVSGGRGPVVAGAKFIGGSDDYGQLWASVAGFQKTFAHNIETVSVDRHRREIVVDSRVPEASAQVCRGRNVVLFVTAEK